MFRNSKNTPIIAKAISYLLRKHRLFVMLTCVAHFQVLLHFNERKFEFIGWQREKLCLKRTSIRAIASSECISNFISPHTLYYLPAIEHWLLRNKVPNNILYVAHCTTCTGAHTNTNSKTSDVSLWLESEVVRSHSNCCARLLCCFRALHCHCHYFQ